MKSVYERANLIITEFDTEDVITTSGAAPVEEPTTPISPTKLMRRENAYGDFTSYEQTPGEWF